MKAHAIGPVNGADDTFAALGFTSEDMQSVYAGRPEAVGLIIGAIVTLVNEVAALRSELGAEQSACPDGPGEATPRLRPSDDRDPDPPQRQEARQGWHQAPRCRSRQRHARGTVPVGSGRAVITAAIPAYCAPGHIADLREHTGWGGVPEQYTGGSKKVVVNCTANLAPDNGPWGER